MAEEELTEKQAEEMLRSLQESKINVASFFKDVVQSDDTTKTGNLSQEELGIPKVPVRTMKELELFSKDVFGQEMWATYFKNLGEIALSTSLSKEAILLKLLVTQKRELSDMTPKDKKKNKGWFKKKENEQ